MHEQMELEIVNVVLERGAARDVTVLCQARYKSRMDTTKLKNKRMGGWERRGRKLGGVVGRAARDAVGEAAAAAAEALRWLSSNKNKKPLLYSQALPHVVFARCTW